MVIVSGTFTFLSRLVGAVAGKTLGWAVILMFGRVPQARLRLLSFMALAAVGWLIAVAALLVPTANELVVAAVPHVAFVQRDLIGWLLVAAALLLPAAVGAAMIVLSPEDEASRPARGARILWGYPFTAVLAATIVFLAAWSVVRAARSARRGWESVHVPMIVKPDGYDSVVDDIGRALAGAGLVVTRSPAAGWFLVLPQLLAFAGGLEAGRGEPDGLVSFTARELEVLVYPSDVAVLGEAELVARARSAIGRGLVFSDAYLTVARESEQIEDRLRELAERPFVQVSDFQPIDAMLTSLPVPYDEWETLLRLRLQVEHEVLVRGRRSAAEPA
jgi:hypothetical protein